MDVEYRQLCTFRLADREMGVPVSEVREVLRSRDVTPLPRAPASVAGLSSRRGEIALSIDLRTRFGFEAATDVPNASNVVVDRGDSLYMLLVDEIGDIVDVDAEYLGPVPQTFDLTDREFVDAVFERGSRWILVLDIDAILALGG